MTITKCDFCPRKCGIDRTKEEIGFCGAKEKIEISWYGKHFGEEPVLSGKNGSGAIFFCRCNLKCVFCQNWQISQEGHGCKTYLLDEVVKIIFELEKEGANNINLVSPNVWALQIKEILLKAREKGLKIPVVWNSNGYEDVEVLREFEGLVDIYLPDFKYANEDLAVKYSSAPNYPKIAKEAILEMYRQVGDLEIDSREKKGKSGLVVRHLILPSQLENTRACLKFIREVSDNIYLSLMSQYNPMYQARNFPEICHTLSKKEYDQARNFVNDLDFQNGWIQEFDETVKCLVPNFNNSMPFGGNA